MDRIEKRRVNVGDAVRVRLPYSEVCMHMQVAGKEMNVKLLPDGAQLLQDDGGNFSFPILPSEAGFYRDEKGWYLP